MSMLRSGAIVAAVVVGVAATAAPAFADGESDRNRSWRGTYWGLDLGYGEADPADGIVGGGHIGYNWQTGKIVYGWEADASIADMNVSVSDGIDWAKFSVDWMATVRGRVGYLLQPSLLAYATAGLGMYHAELSSSIPGYNISDTETDLVFGLGLESKWSDTTSVRVEYLGFNDAEIDVIRAGISFKLNGY